MIYKGYTVIKKQNQLYKMYFIKKDGQAFETAGTLKEAKQIINKKIKEDSKNNV